MGVEPIWEPSPERVERANITRYLHWLRDRRGLRFASYDELWRWSVDDLDGFWTSIWEFFEVGGPAPSPALAERRMPGARWFPGATLNHAELSLRRHDDHPALLFGNEAGELGTISYAELGRRVAAVAAGLRRLGVAKGDRVVAYLPNVPETVIAMLATASIGRHLVELRPRVRRLQRGRPLRPDRAQGAGRGRRLPLRRRLARPARRPGRDPPAAPDPGGHRPGRRLRPGGPAGPRRPRPASGNGTVAWDRLLEERAGAALAFEPVAFDHPLWVLYSSGTTGLPKAIVHGHGGIALELLKSISLQLDLGPADRFFWFTTTGWMMWNFLVGGLLLGSTVVLYDGSPGHPDMGALWRFAERSRMTYLGTSAAFVLASMKAGVEPARDAGLSALHSIGSTGSPLPPEGFAWLYEHVASDVLVGSTSGGTDVCTSFVTSCPLLPVYPGEIQCRALGAKVESFDEDGRPVVGQVGELVVTEPLPSMPLFFWNDPDGERYRDSYFSTWPGVWRHGDWLEVTERGSCIISGRSDSTLNRGGVRMGTAEFYRVVEGLDEVVDSLVVDVSDPGGEGRLLLFVVLRQGAELDDGLRSRIRAAVRADLSPRHVPDRIEAIAEVPRTLSGKKLEVPVKRVLAGVPLDQAVSEGALANPDAIHQVVALAREPG